MKKQKLLSTLVLAGIFAFWGDGIAQGVRGHGRQQDDKRRGEHHVQHAKPQPKPAKPQYAKPQPPKPQPPKPHPPKPHPPKPQPPRPQPHHNPHYRPGRYRFELERPRERVFYKSWPFLVNKSFYTFSNSPETLQISMRDDSDVEFRLEENTSTGYSWFARYDPRFCKVDIEHKITKKVFWGGHVSGVPGVAEIEIEAEAPGDTMVELIYARRHEWERGEEPEKVIQIFIHIDPEW